MTNFKFQDVLDVDSLRKMYAHICTQNLFRCTHLLLQLINIIKERSLFQTAFKTNATARVFNDAVTSSVSSAGVADLEGATVLWEPLRRGAMMTLFGSRQRGTVLELAVEKRVCDGWFTLTVEVFKLSRSLCT